MTRRMVLGMLALAGSVFAITGDQWQKIDALAASALGKVDVVIFALKGPDGNPTVFTKANPYIVQRYSFRDMPLPQYPVDNAIYAYKVVDGVFIDKPEIELNLQSQLKEILK